MIMSQSNEESNRRIQKLQASEQLLLDSNKYVNICKSEFKDLMPKLFSNFRAISATSFVGGKIQLMNVADEITKCSLKTNSVIQRLKTGISGTYSIMGTGQTGKSHTLRGFEHMLEAALATIINIDKNRNYKNTNYKDKNIVTSANHFTLDMALESTACLAATAPGNPSSNPHPYPYHITDH
jgi:hypothetical protein